MAALVPTLRSVLAQADVVFAEGRVPHARRAYEDLVQRAQEKSDRPTEGMARATNPGWKPKNTAVTTPGPTGPRGAARPAK